LQPQQLLLLLLLLHCCNQVFKSSQMCRPGVGVVNDKVYKLLRDKAAEKSEAVSQ
jgi:hypothetical protein